MRFLFYSRHQAANIRRPRLSYGPYETNKGALLLLYCLALIICEHTPAMTLGHSEQINMNTFSPPISTHLPTGTLAVRGEHRVNCTPHGSWPLWADSHAHRKYSLYHGDYRPRVFHISQVKSVQHLSATNNFYGWKCGSKYEGKNKSTASYIQPSLHGSFSTICFKPSLLRVGERRISGFLFPSSLGPK